LGPEARWHLPNSGPKNLGVHNLLGDNGVVGAFFPRNFLREGAFFGGSRNLGAWGFGTGGFSKGAKISGGSTFFWEEAFEYFPSRAKRGFVSSFEIFRGVPQNIRGFDMAPLFGDPPF